MVRLNQSEIKFILTKMVIPSYIQNKLSEDKMPLTEDELELLYDLCGQHFQLFGIGENDEPNEYGLQLERLLDKIYNCLECC